MIPEYMIDFAKQLEIYINSDYYKDQISIGAFSTRFRKFFLENERAKDLLFMIDVLNGETEEINTCGTESGGISQIRLIVIDTTTGLGTDDIGNKFFCEDLRKVAEKIAKSKYPANEPI